MRGRIGTETSRNLKPLNQRLVLLFKISNQLRSLYPNKISLFFISSSFNDSYHRNHLLLMVNLAINDFHRGKIVIGKRKIIIRNNHQKTKKLISSSANSSGEIQKNKYLCKSARDAEKHQFLDYEQN